MVIWPLYGILRRLTERRPSLTAAAVRPLGPQFRRSMFLFVLDAGCDNMLNLAFAALQAPQYNTHRFGIYFADTPRHADLLVILGPPLPGLREAVQATVEQMPRPFGVLLVDGFSPNDGTIVSEDSQRDPWKAVVDKEHVVGRLAGMPAPRELLSVLLAVQRGGRRTTVRGGSR